MNGSGRPTAAVIIPALNEGAVIGPVVLDILAVVSADDFPVSVKRVIVVDNGSTDDTGEIAASAGASVVLEPRRGFGRACLTGSEQSGDVQFLVFLDGDGSDRPEDMSAILQPLLEDRADLTVGSRVDGGHEPGSLTQPQRFGNWLVSHLLRIRYDVVVTDVGPFRAIRKDDLTALGMKEMTYGWPVEMLARAGKQGLRIESVPVVWRNRAGGESKVSGDLKASIRAAYRFLSVFARVR